MDCLLFPNTESFFRVSQKPSFEPFRLFSSSGSGFLEQSEPPLPPPPPSVEVLPFEILPSVKYTVEPVELGGLTLLRGRVSTQEVFKLSNSDLVPGKYEGGLKLWEGSLDLVKALNSEVQNGHLLFTGKRVLELGCGHGLPGIFACLEGAAAIHFQDFNVEVLQCLTIPNVNSNVPSFQRPALQVTKCDAETEISFFAGDWREIHKLLPYAQNIEKDLNFSTGKGLDAQYDIILMSETVYSISALPHLYELIKKGSWLLAWSVKLQMVLLMSERCGSFRLSRHGIPVDQTLSLFFISLFQSPPLWPPIWPLTSCMKNQIL